MIVLLYRNIDYFSFRFNSHGGLQSTGIRILLITYSHNFFRVCFLRDDTKLFITTYFLCNFCRNTVVKCVSENVSWLESDFRKLFNTTHFKSYFRKQSVGRLYFCCLYFFLAFKSVEYSYKPLQADQIAKINKSLN